jgi:hypothetical protein
MRLKQKPKNLFHKRSYLTAAELRLYSVDGVSEGTGTFYSELNTIMKLPFISLQR